MSAEEYERFNFAPDSSQFDGVRIQLLIKGQWLTVFDVPSRLKEDEGESVEAFYWSQICKELNRAMQLDRILVETQAKKGAKDGGKAP